MATYGDKIRKYDAKVRGAHSVGQKPKAKHVKKLLKYLGKAAEKGADHKVTKWDKVKSRFGDFKDLAKWTTETVLATPDGVSRLLALVDPATSSPMAQLAAPDDDDDDE